MSLPTPGSCGKQRETGGVGGGEQGLRGQKRRRNKIKKPVGKERHGKSAEEGARNETEGRRRSR